MRTSAGCVGLVLAAALLLLGSGSALGLGPRDAADAGAHASLGVAGCAGGIGPVDSAIAWARCQAMLTLSAAMQLARSVCLGTCPG